MNNRKWFINVAMSKDGFIGQKGHEVAISSHQDWKRVHQLRDQAAAIVVGSITVETDNPSLLTKSEFFSTGSPVRHPIRVIIDRRGSLGLDRKVFQLNPGQVIKDLVSTIWVTSSKRIPPLNVKKFSVRINETLKSIKMEINSILTKLGIEGGVMIEGGAKLINSAITENIVSEMTIFRNDKQMVEGVKLFESGEPSHLSLIKENAIEGGNVFYYSLS